MTDGLKERLSGWTQFKAEEFFYFFFSHMAEKNMTIFYFYFLDRPQ